MTTLYQLTDLEEALVVARPSKTIKSPYVADVLIAGESINALAHTPALGCCGLCEKTSKVLVAKSKSESAKCEYVVYCSVLDLGEDREVVVGIHPKLAESVVENALKQNCLKTLLNIQNYKREQTVICGKLQSRFDFMGVDSDGQPFIMEVKSVPLCLTNTDGTKTAFFPDGYRKKKGDVVSPRALKHVQELEEIKRVAPNYRCIMCFVIQRGDATQFQTAITDPEYKIAVKQAHQNGVEIITLCVNWSKTGTATFVCCDLPYSL